MTLAPVLPMRTEPWPAGTVARDCPVCTYYWLPWVGSLLPCHGRCLYSRESARAIYQLVMSSSKPVKGVAAQLGVPVSVVLGILRRPARLR